VEQRTRWTASAFVRNIEDAQPLSFAASIRGTDVRGFGEPRTFGVNLTYDF